MTVSCIVVGLNEWERYTKPMLESTLKSNPDMPLVCVDNGSEPEYPDFELAQMVRLNKKYSYAGGLNTGLFLAPKSDWYIVINNDTLITKPIVKRFETLDHNCLYGFKLYEAPGNHFPFDYLSGWCMFLSKTLIEVVGTFDEELAPMYFEDADLSYRASQQGFGLVELDRSDWGIAHLENIRHSERRQYMDKHIDERKQNRRYVMEKHGLADRTDTSSR